MKLAVVVLLALALFIAPLSAVSPDLIVVISIDQFPQRYLPRFQPWFSKGGFNRFLQNGAHYDNAFYPYANTYTCPGHATIGTGRLPSETGIVSNNWYEPSRQDSMYCVGDDRVQVTAGTSDPVSPMNLQGDSLGDRLLEKYPRSKVIGIAIKDRAAILMAGRKATAAYWLDKDLPAFISSTWYAGRHDLGPFNRIIPAFVAAHPAWTQSDAISPADLDRVTYDPPALREHKTNHAGMGVAFPHPIKDTDALTYTPYGNDLLLDLARYVIDTEKLGTEDGSPDLLFVGLSTQDYIGHAYGPDSLEVADAVVRLDGSLQSFFDQLSQRFGDRVTVALTSDHGVQSIPEVSEAMGKPGGRINFRNPGKSAKTIGELATERLATERRIATALNIELHDDDPIGNAIMKTFFEPSIYLNWKRINELELDRERVRNVVRDAVAQIDGVSAVYTDSQLLAPTAHPTEIERSVRNSFLVERSGDVIAELKPGYMWSWGTTTGTTHGEPLEDDQHVPVLFFGNGIRAGAYDARVSPADIATTLGSLVGVTAGEYGAKPLSAAEPE
ncbi:MAG: alkaline phosphatase family protein [Acidobacteriota bacterium]